MRIEGASNQSPQYSGEMKQSLAGERVLRPVDMAESNDLFTKTQNSDTLDLTALKEMPDAAKTQYEKSEQKRLEKLALSGFEKLDPDQQNMVKLLEVIEREVVMHEMAHQARGGSSVGAATYQYTMGPDYKYYKTGGNVQYKLPYAGTPESMLRAFKGLTKVAMASVDASGQDRKMAAMAEVKIREIKDKISTDKGKVAYYEEMLRAKLRREDAQKLN